MSSSSGKYDLNGWPVWFEKFGIGKEIVLLIPGAIGTGRSDFKEQFEGSNAFNLNKYTFVAIELPGWGRSRPPKRHYDKNVYKNDADCALKLMDKLGHKNYSIISWSEGAKVALWMCNLSPNRIKCAVAIGILFRANEQTLGPLLFTRNTKKWPKEHFKAYLQVYGDEDTIQLLWDQYLDYCQHVSDNSEQYLVNTEDLTKIRTPVLLIHGDKDPMVQLEQSEFCKAYIPNCELHRFPEGSHNCHQKFAAEFKKIVENFFDDSAFEECF